MERDGEPLDRRLGHRVTATAERLLRHLATELADRDRAAGKGAILDALIKRARIEEIEDEFPKKR